MGARPAVPVIGLSGPDGSGKSTLLRVAADAAADRGIAVRTAHLYGCLLCRNLRPPSRVRRALASPGTVALEWADEPAPTARRQLLHAGIDTAELALRLALGRRRAARATSRTGAKALLLTDRSPLDALVKHEPPGSGLIARWLLRVADRYAVIVLLDARSLSLAGRDGEHAPAGLDRSRSGFRRWSAGMERVLPVSTEELSPQDAARLLLDRLVDPGAGPSQDHSWTGSGSPSSSA